jgi:hypothetical protein
LREIWFRQKPYRSGLSRPSQISNLAESLRCSRIPTGNVYLKTALVEAVNTAARSKGTYLRDKFFRLRAWLGYKRAAVAVGAGLAGAGEHHHWTG